MVWEGGGMVWEGDRMMWEVGGMVWEDGGMVWEGGGMMLKIIRSIAINFCKRSTKPRKVFRSSEIHMIKSFIRPNI